MKPDRNLELLRRVAVRIGPLLDRVVFVGGSTTGLLITDPAAPAVRFTVDVDVIASTPTLGAYYALTTELRRLGFLEDTTDGAPVCRFRSGELLLDVMPTREEVLGFSNRWYEPAVHSAVTVNLPDGPAVRVVTAPYFLATKLEAFRGRGRGDFGMSHDLGDVISVVDGRAELLEDVRRAPEDLRAYLAAAFTALLSTPAFLETLAWHLPSDEVSQSREALILERLRALSEQS